MKKLLAAALLSASVFNASAKDSGKVTIIVSLTVDNYAEWQKAFDAGAPVREKAGIKVLQVCSLSENGNEVMVIEEAPSLQSAKDFIEVLKKRAKPGASNVQIKLYNQHS
jgi:hypothetical protein